MNFAEQPPSKAWAPLTYQGQPFAEVWFKPDGLPFALQFRIPQSSFHIPGLSQLITPENLVKALPIPSDAVESCSDETDTVHDLKLPLPPPAHEEPYRTLLVKLLHQTATGNLDNIAVEVSAEKWHLIQTRWNFVLGLEVAIDTTRQRMESLRTEIESALNKALAGDEKVYAANADVAHWNKTKSRARFAVPKVKEFLHRATWAMATPERKKLEELFKQNMQAPVLTDPEALLEEIEHMLKDRQILSAQGVTIYQECKNSVADIHSAMRTLQSNAQKKKVASRAKAKKN